jgi:hypothetical protein
MNPQLTGFAADIDGIFFLSENDFPAWDRSARSERGWWEFRNRRRRLLVKNINVSTEERRTGADLVYARRNPDTIVLVQYKMMEQLETGDWVFRPQGTDGTAAQRALL